MNAKVWVFIIICTEAIIYLLLYILQDYTFKLRHYFNPGLGVV